MKLNHKPWFRPIPAVIWMAVIFYMSSKTGDEVSSLLPIVQKYFPFITDFNWGHYVTYFVLAITFDYMFKEKSKSWLYKGIIIILCTLYGITDELHQSFVGGRMMDILDLRNDAIGAAAWTLLVKIPMVERIWIKLTNH